MTITNDIPLEHLHTPAGGGLSSFPHPDEWDDWVDYGPNDLPDVEGRHYALVPTVCFNCEAACGLLAYVDKQSHDIHKIEGHPLHPGSRGRNCPKGPATLNQVNNPDRILKPLKRVGRRGDGRWEEVTWDEALDDIAGRIRAAIQEDRRDGVVYHVGRPGEDGYTERVIAAWGVDGHNSHTNVCSSSARAGYSFWMGMDRPNPDYEHAKFILLMSSHLESGHYFNPHAQRIIDAKLRGTKVAVVDTRLSNTASQADIWLSPSPGTEAAMLLAMANHLIQNDLFDAEFVRRWVNWQDMLEDWAYLDFLKEDGAIEAVPKGESFEDFVELLKQMYWQYTPEWAEEESGVPAEAIVAVADEIARAGTAFASHIWRNAAAGHLGGWMITRCLFFLNVLTGSVATKGGTIPNGWTKFVPKPHTIPRPIKSWNENHWPLEFPLAHFEMSFLLPHILKDNGSSIDVYFTRVYNPVWTNPDGTAWVEMLEDDRIGLHVALTPVWSETAQWADYVLPTGLGPERHDLHSLETHASQWIGWRQPVIRALKEKLGHDVADTRDANPGDVWEENEFWIELSWRIDPDGSMGIRRHFESPFRPGEKITVNDYYRHIFENGVPGLPEKAADEGLTPFEYMRKYAAFEVTTDVYDEHECPVDESILNDPMIIDEDTGLIWCAQPGGDANNRPYPGPFRDESGKIRIGIEMDGRRLMGFPTPSAAAGVLLADAQGVGMAAVRGPALSAQRGRAGAHGAHRQPGASLEARPRRRRVRPSADVSAAEPDPQPHERGEVVVRDRAHQPRVGQPGRCGTHGRGDGRPRQGGDGDRVVRRPRVGYGVDQARGRGVLAPHGPVAAVRGARERPVELRRRRPFQGRRRVEHAPEAGRHDVEVVRPRLGAAVVVGRRGAPEPHHAGAARPDQRSALLAPEGARHKGGPRRQVRRRKGRLGEGAPGIQALARTLPSGPRPRRHAPPVLAAPPHQAHAGGVSGVREHHAQTSCLNAQFP